MAAPSIFPYPLRPPVAAVTLPFWMREAACLASWSRFATTLDLPAEIFIFRSSSKKSITALVAEVMEVVVLAAALRCAWYLSLASCFRWWCRVLAACLGCRELPRALALLRLLALLLVPLLSPLLGRSTLASLSLPTCGESVGSSSASRFTSST